MANALLVKGHGLLFEGNPFTRDGSPAWSSHQKLGYAKCSCGQLSPEPLDSRSARKRWHRQHKQTVLLDTDHF